MSQQLSQLPSSDNERYVRDLFYIVNEKDNASDNDGKCSCSDYNVVRQRQQLCYCYMYIVQYVQPEVEIVQIQQCILYVKNVHLRTKSSKKGRRDYKRQLLCRRNSALDCTLYSAESLVVIVSRIRCKIGFSLLISSLNGFES